MRVAMINAQLAVSKVEAVAMEIRNRAITGIMSLVFQIGSLVINDKGNDGVKIGDLVGNLTNATGRKSRKSLSLKTNASAILMRKLI